MVTLLKTESITEASELMEGLNDHQKQKIDNIANNLKTIFDEFDYEKSPDFAESIKDKSETYINFLKQSFSQAHNDRLYEALRNIEHKDTIFGLVQADHQTLIESIRTNLRDLNSSEGY